MVRSVGLLVLCSGLATLAPAHASPQFGSTFELTYLPSKPAASGGIETNMTWSDPGEQGGKPKRIIRISFASIRDEDRYACSEAVQSV